jgi:iron complex outermembrane receptor protein
LLRQQPGLDYSGQGGLFQTVSLRGMSRQRLGAYYQDIPLFTERRAGTAVSFIDPSLVQTVELVRGPASVLHGTGAIGGLLRVHPARLDGLSAQLGWGSSGDENQQFFGYGNDQLELQVAHRGANNSQSAAGDDLNTGFDQYNVALALRERRGDLELGLDNLFSYADDIGKSNRFYPDERISDYPRERHWLTQVSAEIPGIWRSSVFLHAQDLETSVERLGQRLNEVDNQSLDYGAKLVLFRGSELNPLRLGLDYLARRDVDADETRTDFDTGQRLQWQIMRADRDEVAIYADLQHSLNQLQWAAGIRTAWTRQQAENFSSESEAYASGFAGVEWFSSEALSFSLQLSAGQRPANLSERFFNGTTGRGTVLGNPDLDTETAVTIDLGTHWENNSSSILLRGFHTSLDDLIERVQVSDELLSFRNNRNGKIYGAEISLEHQLGEHWALTSSGHYLDSEDDDNNTLQDTAADRINLGLEYRGQHWNLGVLYEYRFSTDDVASTELPVDSTRLLSARATLELSEQLSLELWGRNLLDDRYVISTDDLSTEGEERSLGIRLSWRSPEG